MSDLTVPPNDPEREPVRHWAALDSQSTTCGRPRAGTGEPWTDDPETPVTCPACLAVLANVSAMFAAYTGETPIDQPEPVHFDPDTMDRESPCGLDLDQVAAEHRSTNPAQVTCALCSATLTTPAAVDTWVPVDWCRDAWHGSADRPTGPCPTCGQTDQMDATTSNWLSDDLRRCANCDEPVAFLSSRDWCDGCEEEAASAPAEPERCTVGLEVLTDELRGIPMDYEAETGATNWPPNHALVGVVIRHNGEPICVPDVDSDWRRSKQGPTYILARLLDQMANTVTNGLDGTLWAALLMPGADVLAALSGRPVGGYTASVPVCVEDIRAGWWVLVEEGPSVYAEPTNTVLWRLVLEAGECPDPACEQRGDGSYHCRTLTLQGAAELLHRRSYRQIKSRIPATTEVQQ